MKQEISLLDRVAREDRLVAALCHASALMPFMGMVVPLAIWLSQRQRSPSLRFHALQALAYQGFGVLMYFLLAACQFLVMFAMFPLSLLFSNLPATRFALGSDSPQALILIFFLLLLFGVLLLSSGGYFLGGPLFILIALIGGWRVLDAHDFRYPVLGKMIEQWLGENE